MFHTLKSWNQNEIVYTENLRYDNFMDEHMSNNHFDHDMEDDGNDQSDRENQME